MIVWMAWCGGYTSVVPVGPIVTAGWRVWCRYTCIASVVLGRDMGQCSDETWSETHKPSAQNDAIAWQTPANIH